jgi:hypothetical protein
MIASFSQPRRQTGAGWGELDQTGALDWHPRNVAGRRRFPEGPWLEDRLSSY